jgi:hypothetical protein
VLLAGARVDFTKSALSFHLQKHESESLNCPAAHVCFAVNLRPTSQPNPSQGTLYRFYRTAMSDENAPAREQVEDILNDLLAFLGEKTSATDDGTIQYGPLLLTTARKASGYVIY